jgi:hypothetical protein
MRDQRAHSIVVNIMTDLTRFRAANFCAICDPYVQLESIVVAEDARDSDCKNMGWLRNTVYRKDDNVTFDVGVACLRIRYTATLLMYWSLVTIVFFASSTIQLSLDLLDL